MPALPHRRYAALCWLFDACHAPRPQEVSVPVLDLLGHDGAAGGYVYRERHTHLVVVAPRFSNAPRTAGRTSRSATEKWGQRRCNWTVKRGPLMPVTTQETEIQRPPVHDQPPPMPPAHQQLEFVRFRPLHRALHVCMVISFITLALTGLSLKFSYTGWASRLSHLLGGFQTAGFIHRSAAFLMFTAF